MSLVNLTINGKHVSAPSGTSILDAAKLINIKIHNLCHLHMNEIDKLDTCASCRVFMVETERGLVPACGTVIKEGMKVQTNSAKALNARRTIVELLLSDHPQDCFVCEKNGDCELQTIAADLGVRKIRYQGSKSFAGKDTSTKSLVKDHSKCILCRRCETVCNDIQTVGALSGVNRGFNTLVSTFFNSDMVETECTFCGQCISVCPTGALTEVDNVPKLWDVLNKKEKTIVVQVAPAVRVAIGEEFGLEPGSISTGKMVAALKALGFEHVFDTNFGADFTIMEEATEFIERIQKGENLPILTSCCPAWVNFLEHNYPDKLNLASSCKSPQGMFGSIAKNYYAPKILGINPEELYVVSVMPCVAKKYEASREELSESGILDVDLSITTRELAKMIKEAAIDLPNLQDQDFDNPLGKSTGAASIFGASGGVLEAALRTSYEKITNKTLDNVNFTNVRGLKGIREASIDVDGTTVNVCIVNTLKNARKIMDKVRSGECKYHIIEVMACPGGCVGGAGQPYHHGNTEIVDRRANALYEIDRNKAIRKSHENPDLQAIYKDFFGEPNSDVAHKYLHTHYFDKSCVYGECPQECACEEAK